MKAFRIDTNGVTEIEGEETDILTRDIHWDCVTLDDTHDVWVNDEGLLGYKPLLARIGTRDRLPLPAYILGADGEDCVDATLTLREVRALVRIDRRTGSPEVLNGMDLPAIGIDSAIDADGALQPWRAVLAFPGDERNAVEFLIRLPRNGEYQSPTVHPIHGDLFELPLGPEEQALAISDAMRLEGFDFVGASDDHWKTSVMMHLRDHGVSVSGVMMYMPPDIKDFDDPYGIGKFAGHEIAHIQDEELRMRRLHEWHEEYKRQEADAAAANGQASDTDANQTA